MNWKIKASIMKVFSILPNGYKIYEFGQKRFGRLNGDPNSRIPSALKMLLFLKSNDITIKDKVLFEVGTGHVPILPLCFYLAGANKILTYDLNKRLQLDLLSEAVLKIIANKKNLKSKFLEFVEEDIFNNRMAVLEKNINNIENLLEEAKILYTAPGDAADSSLETESVDIHFSCTTFEHIPQNSLELIIKESFRVLKKNGVSIHFIDPSDHFQHQDRRITKINFLKYNSSKWSFIGGNEFAYCNRLRFTEYKKIFLNEGFELLKEDLTVDEESKHAILNGFQVDNEFKKYSLNELCTTHYDVLFLKP